MWLWESNRFLGGPPTDDPFAVAQKYLKSDMIGAKIKGWVQLWARYNTKLDRLGDRLKSRAERLQREATELREIARQLVQRSR